MKLKVSTRCHSLSIRVLVCFLKIVIFKQEALFTSVQSHWTAVGNKGMALIVLSLCRCFLNVLPKVIASSALTPGKLLR